MKLRILMLALVLGGICCIACACLAQNPHMAQTSELSIVWEDVSLEAERAKCSDPSDENKTSEKASEEVTAYLEEETTRDIVGTAEKGWISAQEAIAMVQKLPGHDSKYYHFDVDLIQNDGCGNQDRGNNYWRVHTYLVEVLMPENLAHTATLHWYLVDVHGKGIFEETGKYDKEAEMPSFWLKEVTP